MWAHARPRTTTPRAMLPGSTVHDPVNGTRHFARVKVPNNVPRLIRVEQNRDRNQATFLPLEELIANHLGELFDGLEVTECHVFRVTRNADFEVEEDRDEDLLQALERELARRRFGLRRTQSRGPGDCHDDFQPHLHLVGSHGSLV